MQHVWGGRRRFIILAIIVAIALALRLWGIAWGLEDATIERRPHPDEWVVYWLWQWFDAHHNLNPCPNSVTRQCFFDWGSVFIYLSYGFHEIARGAVGAIPVSSFGRHADPVFVRFVLAGRLFSALMSTATVVLVYRAGSLAYGAVAGLVAAAVLALSALPIQLGHFATPDATVSLLVTLALLLALAALRNPSATKFLAAGAVVGVAAGTEYHLPLLFAPLVAAWLLARGRKLWLAGSGLAAVAGYCATNPYVLVELPSFLAAMRHTILIRTVQSGAQYQGRFDAFGPAWLYVVRFPLGYGAGFALTILLLAGLVSTVWRRRREDLVLLAWTIPYLLLVTLSAAKFMRYSAPLFPPLALLAGAFVAQGFETPRRLVRMALAVSIAGILAFTSTYDFAYDALFARPEPRFEATQWIRQHVSPSRPIAFEQLPNGLINLPYFVTAAGYRPCIAQFDPTALQGPAHFVVVDDYDEDEHPRVPDADVKQFRSALQQPTSYVLVKQFHYEPKILSLEFPIDSAPHDWRYVDHDIEVYRVLHPSATPSPYCFDSMLAATQALYVPTSAG